MIANYYNNVKTLLKSAIIAQLIPIIFTPIFSRVFSTSEHGLYSLYFSILAPITAISALRYELAIPLPKSDKKANQIIFLSLSALIIVCFSLFLFLYLSPDSVYRFFKIETVKKWIILVPFSIFLHGLVQIINNFSNRIGDYKSLGKSKLYFAIFTNILPFLFVKIKGGLIYGYIISQLLLAFYLIFSNLSLLKKIKNQNIYFDIKDTAREYLKFPLLNAPSALIDQISNYLPIYYIMKEFNLSILANYSMTNKIVSIPSIFISYSVSQVLLQEITHRNRNNFGSNDLIKYTIKNLLLIGFTPFLILLFFGKFLFVKILGNQWELAGISAQIISLSSLLKFIVSTISIALIAHNKLIHLAFWNILKLLIFLIFLYVDLSLTYIEFNYFIMVYDLFIYFIYLLLIVHSIPDK